MKKFYSVVLLAMLCCIANNVTAQQVPNPSFEEWNGEKFNNEIQPSNWYVSNISQAGFNFNLAYREAGHTGAYSLMVKDTEVGALGITELSPGYFSLGKSWTYIDGIKTETATAGITGGLDWTHRPDTVSVWIKRTGPHTDKEDFYILYYAWNGTAKAHQYKNKAGGCADVGTKTDEESDIRQALNANACGTDEQANQIAEGMWRERNTYAEWTNIRVPIYYFSDEAPAKMNLLFSASNYPNFRDNTGLYKDNALYVDDIEMVYSSKIDKLYIREREWKAFDPNSSAEQVYSVGKATEIPSVFGVRGAGIITNARGNKATFSGRKLTNEEFRIVQQGAIDGDPMIIQVTATDNSSTTTYKIKFVSAASNNARLADIQVNGTTINNFNAYINTYNVQLPYGTTDIPVVTATAQDAGATVTITQPTSTTGTATIHVAAADGTTTNTYTLNFSVAQLSDNTLEAIYIDGELVPGFLPTTNNYTIILPLGTAEVPLITWQSAYADGEQTITLTKNSLEEGAQITVSAPAAQSTRTYKLTYKIEASSYAYLAGISLNGQPIEGFSPEQTNYSFTLPIGTTTLPAITWTQGDPYQTVVITEGGVDGTTRIVVTAAAGNTVTYRLTFSSEKSTNNALQDILLDGVSLNGFHPDTLHYTVTLPAGTTSLPIVTYTKGDEYQSVTVSTNNTTHTVRVVVKAADGSSRIYVLSFEIEKSANALLQMIYLDGDSLDNFSPEQLTYIVALEHELIPNITVDQTEDQRVNIVQPDGFGTAHIMVLPEIGTPIEYTIIFTSASEPAIPDFATDSFPLSSDVSLAAIYVNGELYQENPLPQTYTYNLPWRTAQMPSVVPVAGAHAQTITVTSPGLNQTTTIHVVAEDGITTADYAIDFPVAKSSNTQLELIEIDGITFDYDPSVREYTIVLPYGTTTLPAITFTKAEVEQRVQICTNGKTTPATIKVTAEDGTEGIYTLTFQTEYSTAENILQSIIVENVGALDMAAGTELTVALPYGTTEVHFSIVKQYPEQSVTIVNGGVSSPTSIVVKPDDPAKAETIYTIIPNVAQYDPATLLDLQVNGTTLPQFQPDVYNYVVSVETQPTITWTTQAGSEVIDEGNTKEMVLLVENDGYAHTYTITYYYPGDLTFDIGFEEWVSHKNDNTGRTGSYPKGWYAPINAITSGDKGTYYPDENTKESTDETQGEKAAQLNTTYLLTSADAMPGFLSLSEPTVSIGYWGLGVINQSSTLSFGAPRTFRNTPDQVQLDYKYQEHKNNANGWRFIYNANNQQQVNYAQSFSAMDQNWHTLTQDITYAANYEPANLDILISAAPSDVLSDYYTNFGTNRSSSTMYFDNLRLNYSSALNGVYVNGVAATMTGADITATIDADYYGLPSLVFEHAVKDQMPVVTWSAENNGVRTATITNYAEDGSSTTYTLTVARPVSTNTTCVYTFEDADLVVTKASPYQTINVQREATRYTITVTAEDGSTATYYADIQGAIDPAEPVCETTEAQPFQYASSSATLNGVMMENGVLVYETTSPLDTITVEVTDTAYHLDVFGEAGFNHYCVNRQASDNALLAAIHLDGIPLAEFYESTFTYQLTVPTMPLVTAVPADPNAQVHIVSLQQDDTHYVVFIQVTAPNGYTKQGYTVAINIRTLRSTALLSDIRANNVSIDGFSPTTFDYHIVLLTDEVMPTFKAIAADGASVLTSTTQQGRITTIIYEVTAEDGSQKNTYRVEVEQQSSSVCTLDAIYLDGEPLEEFDPSILEYDVLLPAGTTSLPEVTASVTDPAATLQIQVDTIGMSALITVTAENNDQRNYLINFAIAKSTDATLSGIFTDGTLITNFDPWTFDYTINLPFGANLPTLSVTTSDPMAVATILTVDSLHYDILVTAEDATTTITYTVTFRMLSSTNSNLLNIFLDGEPMEGFSPAEYEYVIALPYGATIPEVTWQVADAEQIVEAQWEGQTCRLTVTAGDQTTISEYVILFTYELSDNNYLLSITLDGELMDSFHRDTLSYTITYPVGTQSEELLTAEDVLALPEDPSATVTVQEQGTTLVIIVTAANGDIRAYSIEQVIELSNEARLSMIYIDSVAIDDFDPDTYEYTLKLPQGAVIPQIAATPLDTLYAEVELGMEKTLDDGTKLVEIDGIAQDGTRLTYSIYFTFANWTPNTDAVVGDCLFFPVQGTHNTFRAVTISLGVKCAIYTFSGQLITIMDVPVLDVNSVEVVLNENGEQVIQEGSVPNDALGADYVARSGEPFVYIFYNTNTKRIGRGGKYMAY